ncbi:sensor histidine kinase [Bacteroidota bacterium]
MRIITKYISPALFYSEQYQARAAEIAFFSPLYIMSHTFSIYSVVFLVAFIKLVKQWYDDQQKKQQLSQEKLEAELKYLKAQINPHVLFNVLNNLYGLSLAGSKQTPEMILKLSSLLDFMLYECNTKFILLSKEINMLKDYIALEKLRFGDRLTIDFKTNENISNIQIAPLLLFPLVENSFKHGAGQETEKAWIKIETEANDSSIIFSVENSRSDYSNGTEDDKEGIGLKNVKRRLELLYKDRFSLEIDDNKSYFLVKLVLDYNENADEN